MKIKSQKLNGVQFLQIWILRCAKNGACDTLTHTRRSISSIRRAQKTRFSATRIDHFWFVAPESARKIAAKNRSPMPTGIGGSFQLANSASPLGVIDSASAPTARMKGREACENRPQPNTAWEASAFHAVVRKTRCKRQKRRDMQYNGIVRRKHAAGHTKTIWPSYILFLIVC